MFLGFWSWVLVIIVVTAIFYANKLPQLKEQAEDKLKQGKVLLEKSKKELEAKAIVLAEKAKEKQKVEAEKKEKQVDVLEDTEITEEDLNFMPEQKTKKSTAKKTTKETE